MVDCSRNGGHDFNMASRKAEEAAWRRYDASQWLESQVGPLGISNQPTERELVSCLRNGLVLCNVINKIHPGAVPKVVDIPVASQPLSWDSQPLPAYQYFENVRNFLVAAEELKIPAFEASDLERDSVDMGSASKVVECILSLKSFQESKQINNENDSNKQIKSPLQMQSASRMHSKATTAYPSDACRPLDLSATLEKTPPIESNFQQREESVESIVRLLVDRMLDAKENINGNIHASLSNGLLDPIKLFNQILSNGGGEQPLKKLPEDIIKERTISQPDSTSTPASSYALPASKCPKCHRTCIGKCTCSQQQLLEMQKKELLDLKALKLKLKVEFEEMQSQFQRFFNDLGSQVQEMSVNALGYHKVVEENRKLYNMVQDLKGNIRVYCRIRPSFRANTKSIMDFVGENGSLLILDPSKTLKDGRKHFQFNEVFGPTASQDEVFERTQPLIRSVMDGYNVCIFAYGQTGSGKTHTMSGPSGGTSKDMGINYLALNDLFQLSNQREDIIKYDICVQMVEIYNEQVRDLLVEDKADNRVEIRSCNGDGLSLPDATLRSVKSTSDVLTLMKLGEVNRAVSSTAINNRSSRSHSVLTVHVHGKDTSRSTIHSCLHLVDLAGSERVDKSEVTGDRLKEAQFINKSLSCLGDVITALAQKNSHIPYRNSKLTLLLQDSLGGHAKTLMFAHVSPEADSFSETMSTLKFAQRVSTVELGAARLNKETSEVMELKEQLENLKIALANQEAQNAMFNRTKEPYTLSENTQFRHRRRSSIENCSSPKIDKSVNPEDKSGTDSSSSIPRSRRLSLEGPKSIKKDTVQTKVAADVSKTLRYESVSLQRHISLQDPESVSKSYGHFSNGNSRSELLANAPSSPTSITYQKRLIKIDSEVQIHPIKLPQTPELGRKDADRATFNDLAAFCNDSQKTKVTSSTNGKESHIRRSLRTIGKLIIGTDKRSQHNVAEVKSPINVTSHTNDVKTPRATTQRTKRRHSLTGMEAPRPNSRRSSLEGNPVVPNVRDRNARTPPPVRPTTKISARWA
ncbi:PREDICTED: kinesin-like protein KIN-14L [Lupinus angustifolius]|uniref:kinesin-like protein KIN-14L n=1 Tax=Lupinus angustifolius TaxID=3871 RepID=UPI00092E82E7|nr:PREDICTED: kinesin-like protein KIN-14L [Lupinus angustifolius]